MDSKRGNVTQTRAETEPVIEYPVEFLPPDITPWRDGTTNVPFVHSFEGARSGPHLLMTAVVHGNEPAGAVALDRLLSQRLRPSRGRLTLAFANVGAYERFDTTCPRASPASDVRCNAVPADLPRPPPAARRHGHTGVAMSCWSCAAVSATL